MSDIPSNEYKMEAGTSGLLGTCDESGMLIESVNDVVEKETTQDGSYFVVTEVNGEQTNLIQITEADKIDDGTNSDDGNQPWAEICRICANASDHLIPIFKGEGLEHELNNKIHKYLPIQVSEEDDLPLHLCYHCAATLLAWHELVDGCLDAEQRLLQMQNEFQQKSQSNMLEESLEGGNAALATEDNCLTIKDDLSEEQHIIVKGECNEDSTANDTERCLLEEEEEEEEEGITSSSIFKTIEQSVDEDGEFTYGDTTIDVTVMYSKEQDSGIAQCEGDSFVLMIPENKPDDPNARVYGCRTCNLHNLMFREFTAHVSSHSSDNGEECGEEYESQEALHAAVTRSLTQSTMENFDCEICANKFDSQAALLEHLQLHTEEETYTCDYCGVGFTAILALEAHVSLDHRIPCPDCDARFDTEALLKNHMKEIHTDKISICCETCGKVFPNKSSLRHHMIRHSNEQPYVCKTCNRAFKRTSSLYMHERAVHQKIKEFLCVICNKKFALKTQMQTHMRVHTGERPYACDICTQTFKTTSQLQLHKDVHFDNRPFPCEYCDKKFRRRPNLILHLRTHTGEKPYLCDLCGRGFAQRGDMRKHKVTHFKLKTPSNNHGYCHSSVSSLTNYIRFPRSSSFGNFRTAYQSLLQSYQRRVRPLHQSSSRHTKSDQWLDIVSLDDHGADRNSPVDMNCKIQLTEKHLISTIVLQSNDQTDISNDGNKSLDLTDSSVIPEAFCPAILNEHKDILVDVNLSKEKNVEEKNCGEDAEESVAEIPSVSTKILYDCKVCNKRFQSEASYRAHMNIHNDSKRFTCHICGKQFGQTGSLYYHLKHVHGGVKQHSCDICGRSFAMKAAMEDHRRIHTGERPYCCASCGKTFKTKASLYIHSKTHTDELPHKCSYCPKAFRWRQQMLGHLTIHTGQKNHICEICGKRFGVKNDLTRHKRIHSEEKPFTCQQCGLSFGQKRYLKNHERTRHT